MSYLAQEVRIGGKGGTWFDFNGSETGATLQKIWVWAGGWQIKSVKVWLTDGQCKQFGVPGGKFSEFTFEDGEHFTSLSLWGNGAGTRLGAIRFKTSHSREFFPQMTDWGLKTEYPVDVGSGICIGIAGGAGDDIDYFGFLFINTIMSTTLTGVQYPTLNSVIPDVAVDEIKSMKYTNMSNEEQDYRLDTSKTVTKTSSWSVTNKLEFTFNFEVKATVPEIAEVKAGFAFKVGTDSTYKLDNTEQSTELFSFPVKVPPGKTMAVNITIGRATVDLPYTGTVEITCYNGQVLRFKTTGNYKGVTYTDAKIIVNEDKGST